MSTSDYISCALNILVPVISAIIVNAIIFTMKWDNRQANTQEKRIKYLPPGAVIGMIWIVILGLLGYVRWLVASSPLAKWTITFIIVFCVTYPFYTLGLQQSIGRVMNVITLIVACVGFAIVSQVNTDASWYMIPLVVWASYVNVVQML